MQQSEQEKIKRANVQGEFIHRKSNETFFVLDPPTLAKREPYPWEKHYLGKHPKITKEYFRCKGSSLNPPHHDHKDPARDTNYLDCGGFQKHSLPIKAGQEFIYPILLSLVNYVQEKTGHKVVITCGHRCPVHNAYADSSLANRNSKHMIGAEVDFYVQGMEEKPEEIIALLIGYYKGREKEYETFTRQANQEGVFSNQEVTIKLYQKHEGRDFDNRHPYPYISIQVRYDTEKKEKVVADWQAAFKGYQRF